VRILIIDDHPLFREILRQYVEDSYPDARIFEAGSVQEAMAVLVEYAGFGLITLDVSLPEMDGIAGLALIRAMLPVIPVMMMSGVNDTSMAHLAMAHGANGYVSKSAGGRELKHAMHLILGGDAYISPCVLISKSTVVPPPVPEEETLGEFGMTPRQLEVCRLLMAGLPNKAIARRLACAEGTVRLHVSAVLRALNVRNRTEAARVALRLGID
jgi:DNA-binding NarL/FixJ family response regulator